MSNNNTTVLSVKLDKKLKKEAQEVAKSAGFPLSTLVGAYLRQLTQTRRIDFTAPEPMTPHLEKLISKVDSDIRARKNLVGPFNNAQEFINSLEKRSRK